MHIQIEVHRTSEKEGFKVGIRVEPARYFYYPLGDYDAAIKALLASGFVEGNVTPPAPDFYTA